MSAVFAGRWFRAPARLSSSKMGRPVGLHDIVPGRDRKTYKHKIYWAQHLTKTAEQYNSVVTIYNHPCMRRWLDFKGGRIPNQLKYVSHIPPNPDIPGGKTIAAVEARPARYWTVLKDGQEFVCYTNCVEAWFIVMGGEHFSAHNKWAMV